MDITTVGIRIFGVLMIIACTLLMIVAIPTMSGAQEILAFSVLHILGIAAGIGVLRRKKTARFLYLVFTLLYMGISGLAAYISIADSMSLIVNIAIISFTYIFFNLPSVKRQFV